MNITFFYVIVGWIFSLCLHEWAHARVAYEGGDTSVKDKGYLSFNPLKYMDPIFSIVVPMVFLLMGGIGLPGGAVYIDERRLGQGRPQGGQGWPVGQAAPQSRLFGLFPVSAQSISNARWITMMALAGPTANLVLAIVIGLIFRFAPPPVDAGGPALAFIGVLQVEVVLFNLIPIPPLDGYRALSPHLPPQTRASINSLGMMGIFVLFMLFNNVEPLNRSFFNLVDSICGVLHIPMDLAYEGERQFMFWRH